MESDVLERIQSMKLTTEEDKVMTIRPVRKDKILEFSLSLIGRFLTSKSINFRETMNLIQSMWKLGDDLKIVEMGDGLLQFKFSLESQLMWVWNKSPWCFKNRLLAFRHWEKGMTIRMEVLLNKLLRRGGLVISPKGDEVRVAFKYERLVGWCFNCDMIGHDHKECSSPGTDELREKPYGK
nr:hypothetical protein CFP56_66045 [Quercus suber]